MISISEKIKDLRESKNLSQKKLAELAGVSQPTIYNIERGKTDNVTLKVGKGIAKALSVSFGELFNIEGAGNNVVELEKKVKELEEKVSILEKQIADKELIIEMFKSERERIRKDMLHYLEEIHDTSIFFLKDMKDSIGLNDSQIKEIQHNMINLITTISTSYFMGRGLIKEEDWDKVTGKYIGIVRSADKPKEDKN